MPSVGDSATPCRTEDEKSSESRAPDLQRSGRTVQKDQHICCGAGFEVCCFGSRFSEQFEFVFLEIWMEPTTECPCDTCINNSPLDVILALGSALLAEVDVTSVLVALVSTVHYGVIIAFGSALLAEMDVTSRTNNRVS